MGCNLYLSWVWVLLANLDLSQRFCTSQSDLRQNFPTRSRLLPLSKLCGVAYFCSILLMPIWIKLSSDCAPHKSDHANSLAVPICIYSDSVTALKGIHTAQLQHIRAEALCPIPLNFPITLGLAGRLRLLLCLHYWVLFWVHSLLDYSHLPYFV